MAYRFKSGHLSLKSHSLVTGWRGALTRRRGHSFGGPRGTSRNDGSPASGRRCGCKEPALLGLPWAPHLELGLLRGWAGRCVRGEERACGLWHEDMSLGREAGHRDWPSAPRGDAAAAQLPPQTGRSRVASRGHQHSSADASRHGPSHRPCQLRGPLGQEPKTRSPHEARGPPSACTRSGPSPRGLTSLSWWLTSLRSHCCTSTVSSLRGEQQLRDQNPRDSEARQRRPSASEPDGSREKSPERRSVGAGAPAGARPASSSPASSGSWCPWGPRGGRGILGTPALAPWRGGAGSCTLRAPCPSLHPHSCQLPPSRVRGTPAGSTGTVASSL